MPNRVKRTFELGLGCISSPLTLIRNRADFIAWLRKNHLSSRWSPDDAPFYPCLAYTVLHRDENDYPKFLSEIEAYNVAAKMKEASKALTETTTLASLSS